MAESERPMGLTDRLYGDPFVDLDEWRDEPVRHRYVHGGFRGSECLFSMYLPEAKHYEGRFFQPVAPVPGTEHAATAGLYNGYIEFSVVSGAYFVESNLGLRRRALPDEDATMAGFRASAAVATYSRVLAAEMYGEHRPYGYVFGGSGGGYRAMSCIENRSDVWDGGVPYIHGTQMSIPAMFGVQAHAMRILGPKLPQIIDAVDPGGSGNMYAGLTQEERDALAEVTRMGFPPRSWFDHRRVALSYTMIWGGLFDFLLRWDPTYFDDFWTVPGYLGANPTESLTQALVQHKTKVKKAVMAQEALELGLGLPLAMVGQTIDDVPVAFLLEEALDANLAGAMLAFTSGKAEGHHAFIAGEKNGYLTVGIGQVQFDSLRGIEAGDEVLVDNSQYLAFQTHHRHQVPDTDDYREWRQFTVGGEPIYPQRSELVGPRYARNGAGGGLQSGRFGCKMIVVQSMMDEIAYPQQAAWYHRRVQAALGDRIDDQYRVWFVDHAMHGGPMMALGETMRPARSTRIVSYRGVLEQALRDVALWAEQGIAPPPSTEYECIDGQISLPTSAKERKGIQPVVTLTVNGGVRADVTVGETVEFSALVEVPPGTGALVAGAWDFEGAGDYPVEVPFPQEALAYTSRTITESYVFTEPGTYFPALRVVSERFGQVDNPHGRVENLGRVRVVVA